MEPPDGVLKGIMVGYCGQSLSVSLFFDQWMIVHVFPVKRGRSINFVNGLIDMA